MRVKDKTQAYPTDTTVLLGSGDDDADHCYTVHDVRETIGDTVKRELSNDVAAMKTELAEEVETARAEVSTNLAASRVLASDVAQAKTDVESDLQEVQTLAAEVRQNTADVSQAKTTLDENVAAMSAQVDAHTQSVTQMQAELARNHSVAVTLYDTREHLPATIDFAKGIVAKIGESAYCIDTKKWYRCTAVDTETLAVTWEEFDGLGTKLIAGKGISIDAATGAINANTNTYRGTKEAWEALSVAEKITYTDVDFTDYDGNVTEKKLTLTAAENIQIDTQNCWQYGNLVILQMRITTTGTITNIASFPLAVDGVPIPTSAGGNHTRGVISFGGSDLRLGATWISNGDSRLSAGFSSALVSSIPSGTVMVANLIYTIE